MKITKKAFIIGVFFATSILNGCSSDSGGSSSTATSGSTIKIGSTSVSATLGDNDLTVTGLDPDEKYTVWVHDLNTEVSLATYIESSYAVSTCKSSEAGLKAEACTVSPGTDGKLYLRINSSSKTEFTVTVRKRPWSEGGEAAPVDITASVPYSGQVASGYSYYQLTGLNPGTVYDITMSDIMADADMVVAMDKNSEVICAPEKPGQEAESCSMAANFQGEIFIRVNSQDGSAFYTLGMTETTNTANIFEGYSDEPLDLTGKLPYDAQVNHISSYYMVSGLTPGVRYEFRVLNTTVDTQIYMYTSPDLIGASCGLNYAGYEPLPDQRLCVATAPESGTLYLNIPYYGESGGTYGVDLGLAPVAEGTSVEPKEVALASIPYGGQVDTTYSYYVLTGLTPDYVYDVEFNNPTHHYAKIAVGSELDTINAGCGPVCAVRSNANGEIYVRVDGTSTDNENNDLGAWFTLAFGDAENNEGSVDSPVIIPSDGTVYDGQAADGSSYYKAIGLNPGQYYLVHETTDTYLGAAHTTYSDGSFSTQNCSRVGGACLVPADANGELFVLVSYGSIYGDRFKLWINPSLITSEGVGSPVDIASLLSGTDSVYDGQVSSYYSDNESYYKITGLPGTTNYTVSVTNPTDDISLDVYSDAAMTNNLCVSNHNGLVDETCVAQTTATSGSIKSVELYVRVRYERFYNSIFWDGAKYQLTVSQGGENIVQEGAIGTPVDITDAMPYSGGVRKDGTNYYKITGLDPATSYAVMLEHHNSRLGYRILGDSNFTSTNYLCVYNGSAEYTGHCASTPTNAGEMFIQVEGNYRSDEHYVIDIKAAPIAEGESTVPVVIQADSAYAGQVDNTNSYYKVSGLNPEQKYIVVVRNSTDNLYAAIYGGSDYSANFKCSIYGDPPAESCTPTSNIYGELYIDVEGRSENGAFFDLEVRPAPVAEGTIDEPVVIGYQTVYQGSTPGSDGSYYKVTGLVPYSSHRITMLSQDHDQTMTIYTDGTYEYPLCSNSNQNFQTGCGASANANGEIFFKTKGEPSYTELYVP